MNLRRINSIIAGLLIFAGFGMIHSPVQSTEKLGSIFIGIGSLYFIVLIVKSYLKK
ncbi:hypothetical protein [Roseimarinus sediminis]|jgi:hypothetical protein|uniref:hypothetical protein n=1 Tax=Roseimarinus sediminis TaxID=1610899 RepID=UPI003D1BEDFC